MQMSISDVSECVVYVDFNGSVTKMTNVTAAEVAQLMVTFPNTTISHLLGSLPNISLLARM